MRIQRSGALWCAALLATGCNDQGNTLASTPSSMVSNVSLASLTIPQATTEPNDPTLASIVELYSTTWQQAAAGLGQFQASVGAAGLVDSETSQPFCTDKSLKFDVDAEVVLYCQAAHEGPDPLPYTGMILVPFEPYQTAMNLGDPRVNSRGAALLVAMAYVRHVVAEARARGLMTKLQVDRLERNANCVAGLSLRSFSPALRDDEWMAMLDFVRQFHVANTPPWDLREIKAGFYSGQLQSCLK